MVEFAKIIQASEDNIVYSKSLVILLKKLVQEMVRSTTHRLAIGTNPVEDSGRDALSKSRPSLTTCSAKTPLYASSPKIFFNLWFISSIHKRQQALKRGVTFIAISPPVHQKLPLSSIYLLIRIFLMLSFWC